MIEIDDTKLELYTSPVRVFPPDNQLQGVDTELETYATSPVVKAFPRQIQGVDTQLNLTSDSPIVHAGLLPLGLAFVDNGDGTATIHGTPAPGTQGRYRVKVVANNNIAESEQDLIIVIK